MRNAGLRVDFYPDLDNLGRQFRYAEERNIPFALLLGGNELAAGTVTVKDLVSGEQAPVTREQMRPTSCASDSNSALGNPFSTRARIGP